MKKWIAAATVLCALCASSLRAGPWIETARLVHAGGASDDAFAASVAIDGDVAVVGQANGGFARVFVRSGSSWTEAASLVPSSGVLADQFGWSVAISGDTIVVGAPSATVGEVANEGLAYVFVRPGGGWSGTLHESARLGNLDDPETGPDGLGQSVSVSGDTVAVGAPGGLDGIGLTFVFTEPRAGWSGTITPAAVLEAPSGGSAGFSVAISGSTVVAGAPGTNGGEGEAYVWQRPSEGWSGFIEESADLVPALPSVNGQFGDAVAIDETVVVVGSPFARYVSDVGETPVAYVFEMPLTGWAGALNETARMIPNPEKLNSDGPAFGASVSISGDTAVVGTPGLRVFKFSQGDGGAFIFRKPASGWAGDVLEQAKILRIDDSARKSFLGRSVSISSSTIVLGAPQEMVGTEAGQGAAHIFEPGLNPIVTASFSPGSVLTFQSSTSSLTVTNPNTTGFIWNVATAVNLGLPAGLSIDALPHVSNSCGGIIIVGSPPFLWSVAGGDPLIAGASCTASINVSTGIPALYTTSAVPVECDQGCDGAGSGPATLLVRLRQTQTRFLVQGPIRVVPGVPVEFTFRVDALQESPIAPTGEVVVSDGAGHTCRSDVSVSGEGSCSLTFGAPGTYRVRAGYLGNLSFGSSTSSGAPVLVGKGGGAP